MNKLCDVPYLHVCTGHQTPCGARLFVPGLCYRLSSSPVQTTKTMRSSAQNEMVVIKTAAQMIPLATSLSQAASFKVGSSWTLFIRYHFHRDSIYGKCSLKFQ